MSGPVMLWRSPRRLSFRLWLGLVTFIGLAIRVGTVLGRIGRKPGGDPYAYFYGARLLVSGHGFIDPYSYNYHHQSIQSAAYAPLFLLLLAVPVLLGLKSFLVARIWVCVIGALAVPVIGLAGKEMAGRRVGLVAASLAAIYPNLWLPDESLSAEAVVPLFVGLVLLFAYRFWKQPGWARAVWLGAGLGALILGRDELTLLGLVVVAPLVLLVRAPWRRRLGMLVAAGLATAVVIGPWVGFNLSRFEKPTFVSNEAGLTMASASCDKVFYGPFLGYWNQSCALDAGVHYNGDQSVEDAAYEKYALTYLKHHEGRLVVVVAAREGRAFGVFHPMQQILLDSYVETRPYHWAVVGLYSYYVLVASSVAGSVVLRRRRVPVFPLWALGANVVVAVAVAFGNTRYRIPFEVALVLLSAAAVDGILARRPGGADEDPALVDEAADDGDDSAEIPAPAVL